MSRKTRKLIWSAPLVAVLAVAGAWPCSWRWRPMGRSLFATLNAARHRRIDGGTEADGPGQRQTTWTGLRPPRGGNRLPHRYVDGLGHRPGKLVMDTDTRTGTDLHHTTEVLAPPVTIGSLRQAPRRRPGVGKSHAYFGSDAEAPTPARSWNLVLTNKPTG